MNIEQYIATIQNPWSPIEIARFDDHVIRLALFHGEYHWHFHPNGDDTFYVYRGEVVMQMRGREDQIVREGEFFVVPKGTPHCAKSESKSYVVMFQSKALESVRL
ncbi:MAG: cupin domain-containing protein [Patescibacteria group bacterium]